MKVCIVTLLLLGLVASSLAGKKLRKCKAERDALQKEVGDLKQKIKELEEIANKKFEPAANQKGFWPLNREFYGKNLASENSDFTLSGVNFNSPISTWEFAPARFSGQSCSYAQILNNDVIALPDSFSWIAAVNRKTTGDASLFEWDDGRGISTHIWIWQNKLYINIIYASCRYQNMFYSTPVANNRQYIFAVTFDGKADKITMYVDGQKQEKQNPACASGQKPAKNVRVSQRLNDGRRLNAEITCMGFFDAALSYEYLHKNTIANCKK